MSRFRYYLGATLFCSSIILMVIVLGFYSSWLLTSIDRELVLLLITSILNASGILILPTDYPEVTD